MQTLMPTQPLRLHLVYATRPSLSLSFFMLANIYYLQLYRWRLALACRLLIRWRWNGPRLISPSCSFRTERLLSRPTLPSTSSSLGPCKCVLRSEGIVILQRNCTGSQQLLKFLYESRSGQSGQGPITIRIPVVRHTPKYQMRRRLFCR